MRQITFLIAFTVVVSSLGQPVLAQQTLTPSVYVALSSNNLATIDTELKAVERADNKNKLAYEGALRMKRAGFLKGPGNKLKEFKAGREKLEAEISNKGQVAELRFLRLMIQENAPKILGYNKELEADADFLKNHFKDLPESVRKFVVDYSKNSQILKPSDF